MRVLKHGCHMPRVAHSNQKSFLVWLFFMGKENSCLHWPVAIIFGSATYSAASFDWPSYDKADSKDLTLYQQLNNFSAFFLIKETIVWDFLPLVLFIKWTDLEGNSQREIFSSSPYELAENFAKNSVSMTNCCICIGLICLAAMYVVDSFDLPTCCWTNGGQSNFKFKYFKQIRNQIWKKISGYKSGPLAGSINENTRSKKSHATVYLT